jgi:hypothetical protein
VVDSRDKGKRGERELFKLLSALLGQQVRRNINAREGDPDSFELRGWAPEVKNCAEWREEYWKQAVEQGVRHDARPVLFFKVARKGWKVFLDLADVISSLAPRAFPDGHRIEVSLETFATIHRELTPRA